MSAARDDLHVLIDRLPDAELHAARRFLQFLSENVFAPEFAESIRRGIAQAKAGETIVCHDFDDMVQRILGDR